MPIAVTPRGLRTREALLDSARDVFARDGFLAARITDISAGAGVSHGSFYNHFGSKESIFRELIRQVQADLLAPLTPRTEGPLPDHPATKIAASNRSYFNGYLRNARLMATLEEVATYNDELRAIRLGTRKIFVDRSARAIKRWQEAGLARADIDPRYAASALGSMVDRFAYVWLVLGEEFELDTAVTTVTALWVGALGITEPETDA